MSMTRDAVALTTLTGGMYACAARRFCDRYHARVDGVRHFPAL